MAHINFQQRWPYVLTEAMVIDGDDNDIGFQRFLKHFFFNEAIQVLFFS